MSAVKKSDGLGLDKGARNKLKRIRTKGKDGLSQNGKPNTLNPPFPWSMIRITHDFFDT
jgi:hypothetical protein